MLYFYPLVDNNIITHKNSNSYQILYIFVNIITFLYILKNLFYFDKSIIWPNQNIATIVRKVIVFTKVPTRPSTSEAAFAGITPWLSS